MACLAVLHRQVCLNFCIFFRAVDGGQLPMFLSLLGKFPGNTVALWLAKAKLLWSKAISKTFCSSLWSMLFRLINGIKNRNEHKEFITGFKPDCSSHYSVSWLLAITTQDCRQFEERLESLKYLWMMFLIYWAQARIGGVSRAEELWAAGIPARFITATHIWPHNPAHTHWPLSGCQLGHISDKYIWNKRKRNPLLAVKHDVDEVWFWD